VSQQHREAWFSPEGSSAVVAGDNLAATAALPSGAFTIVYLDPPFNTGRIQRRERFVGSRLPDAAPSGEAGASPQASASPEAGAAKARLSPAAPAPEGQGTRPSPAPSDSETRIGEGVRSGFRGASYASVRTELARYNDRFEDFWGFLFPRLEEAWRLLAPDGTLYLHLDYREAHYAKVAMDALVGRECFVNEIIWAYDYGARPKRRWPAKHDTILMYVKDPSGYHFDSAEVQREPYMAPGLVTKEKAARGKLPTDVWWHTIVSPTGKEKTGYPTQKPLGILRRIIAASSREGDWVLDLFAGSGTTGAAAASLGRHFVCVDAHDDAVAVMRKRLPEARFIDLRWDERSRAEGAG
jgi:site-specific DNA-methyltransferase (adenine-specific)